MADTIELEAPKEKVEAVVEAPSREDLRANGWSAGEMDKAEKLGMLPKAEVKKEEKPPEVKVPEVKVEAKKPTAGLPDVDLTPEQEKVLTDTFGPGTSTRAMYFRMKNERRNRQASEARIKELEASIEVLKGVKPVVVEVDPDEENQPLTMKALRELQRQSAEEAKKAQEEQNARSGSVKAAIAEQEEYARANLTDFDSVMERAKDLIQNLDERIVEPWKRAKVVKLVKDLQVAAFHADKFGLDDYNATMIGYEIGQLHPEHGQVPKETGTTKETPKNGRLTPEQMKRVEQNTQRRTPSAALPAGGGSRTVSIEDVTLKDLNDMDFKRRAAFREKHPERYARLLRG